MLVLQGLYMYMQCTNVNSNPSGKMVNHIGNSQGSHCKNRRAFIAIPRMDDVLLDMYPIRNVLV